jgi:hypothetical protein
VADGYLTVDPDWSQLADGEAIPFAERLLAIVEAALTGSLTGEMRRYMIAGRQVETYSPDELMRLRARCQTEVAAKQGAFGVPVVFGFTGLQ